MSPLLELGAFQVTPYSLMVFLGALTGVLFCIRKKEVRPLLPPVIFCALLVSHWVWLLFNLSQLEGESVLSFALRPWLGGYCLYGALFGGMLGALIGARITRTDLTAALDALAPGACAALFFGRLGEYLSGQGFGDSVEDESLWFFPLSYCTYHEEDYQEWCYAVWFWEAAAALILLLVLLHLGKRAVRGERTVVFLTVLSCSQIVLEQMRKDDFVRLNAFVRFSQLAAILTLLVLLILLLHNSRQESAAWLLSFGVLIAASLSIIFAEFLFDKPWFRPWLCLSMAACALLFAGHLRQVLRQGSLLPSLLYGLLTGTLLLLLIISPDAQNPGLLYAAIAAASAAIGVTLCLYRPKSPLSAGRN